MKVPWGSTDKAQGGALGASFPQVEVFWFKIAIFLTSQAALIQQETLYLAQKSFCGSTARTTAYRIKDRRRLNPIESTYAPCNHDIS